MNLKRIVIVAAIAGASKHYNRNKTENIAE